MIARSGLLLTVVLVAALAAVPVAVAQPDAAPAAMVEGSPGDIQSWGFAARVPVGGTLTWTNLGNRAHTVTAGDGSFDSGTVGPGAAAALEFDAPGLFAYACALHPSMKGFVVVSPDASNPGPNLAIVEGKPTDMSTWGFALSVEAGQSVTWANLGTQAHTATAVDGSFDTGPIAHGESTALEFDTPGVFAYLCSPHPWMKGNVAVNPLAAEDLAATP